MRWIKSRERSSKNPACELTTRTREMLFKLDWSTHASPSYACTHCISQQTNKGAFSACHRSSNVVK